ncbi:MAG: FtsQ-type POTRA domain-containing protein [Candidatus Omnitrophota bacterium]
MPRRRYRNKKKKLRLSLNYLYPVFLPVVITILIIGIFTGGYFKLYDFFTEDKSFNVKHVRLVEGEARLKSRHICRLTPTQNIFKIDIEQLAASIERNYSDIHKATVRRVLPDTLVVEISRSLPAAQVYIEGKYYLIDIGGFIISKGKDSPDKAWPVITGLEKKGVLLQTGRQLNDRRMQNVLSLVKIIKAMDFPPPYNQVAKYDISRSKEIKFYFDQLEIITDSNIKEEKIKLLTEIFKDIAKDGKKVRSIDLRFSKDIIVRS